MSWEILGSRGTSHAPLVTPVDLGTLQLVLHERKTDPRAWSTLG